MTNGYVSREQLLAAAAHLLEREEFIPSIGGVVRYRELTGQERLDAARAAEAATGDPEQPDNDMYRAMIVVTGMLEPALSPDDVQLLKGGRFLPVNDLANRILRLSEALPGDLKSSSAANDQRQSDTQTGAEVPEP